MPTPAGSPDGRSLALVAAGGMVGTALREVLTLVVPPTDGVPVGTACINVAGAFLLGLLLESLERSAVDATRQRAMRLLFGTGALGGFTTYSALAIDTTLLSTTHAPAVSIAYAAGTVVLGALAAGFGIAAAAAIRRRHRADGGDGGFPA